MIRTDLMVLTAADLADISNRGTVKRATKELESGTLSWELTEVDGTVTVKWSDGPTSVLPAGRVVAEAECDCAAIGMCRHIIRAVLAYQAENADAGPSQAAPSGPWNPGEITDEQLSEAFSSRMLTSLRGTFEEGLVVELVRSSKPVARFHKLRHTIRFLVPHDVRYTQCDCAEKAPCRHAVLAVWAFRMMGEDEADIVTTGPVSEPLDPELLAQAEASVSRIIESGFANTPVATMDRLQAVENKLRENGVVWPAEILGDVRRQYDHYQSHDARFSPDTLADLVGELLIRLDALRHPDLPIPELFVRGHHSDTNTTLGQTRLVGLGCAVQLRQKGVLLRALMQDDSSGTTVAVSRDFPDPEGDDEIPEDFSILGGKLVVKGRDLATIGAGQLVIKTAKLYSDHRLSLGRSTASVYSQNYSWEDLRPPVHAETFQEVRARLAKLPPSSLRPRRLGEDLHVVRVARVEGARFSTREQVVRATLFDAVGNAVELRHPYTTRNRHGTERLLNWLTRSPEKLLFVGGTYRLAASGLIVSPTGVVFDDGTARILVQPWVDDMDAHLETSTVNIEPPRPSDSALDQLRERLGAEIGDGLLVGVDALPASRESWERLANLGKGLQLFSVEAAIRATLDAMSARDRAQVTRSLLDVAVLSRLAQELG